MFFEDILDVEHNGAYDKTVKLPNDWRMYAEKEGEVIDTCYVALLKGYKKFNSISQSYVLLDVAQDLINKSMRNLNDNNYLRVHTEFFKQLVEAINLIKKSQRLVDEKYEVLDEMDDVIFEDEDVEKWR